MPVLIAGLSGLLLTGGRDVDPSLYDEAPHEQTDIPDHRRDRFELILTRAAIEADLPFLAIGRGMHILNVARGGTLTQHLPDRLGNESHKPDPVKMTTHDLQIAAASKLSGVLGENAQVPASHHQAVNQLGTGLLTVAWTPDQVVEALEVQGHRWGLGVQWNPEEGDDVRLFEALVKAASTAAQPATRTAARGDHPLQAQAARRPLLLVVINRTGLRTGFLFCFRPCFCGGTAVHAGPHRRRVPVQPWRRRTSAISAAVRQRYSVTSGQPYLSVRAPWARLALSRRVSRQRPSAGCAALPSSSTHSPNGSYRLSR